MVFLKIKSSFKIRNDVYNKIFLNNFNEYGLYHLIFSKFVNDDVKNIDNEIYIKYILKNTTPEYYLSEDIEEEIAKDAVVYASNNIKIYSEYIDLIIAIYQYVIDNSNNIPNKLETPKRIIKITRNGSNITIETDEDIISFREDIINHIRFAETIDKSRLLIFINFYRMCKMFLYYIIKNSIKLLSNNENVKQTIDKIHNSYRDVYDTFLENVSDQIIYSDKTKNITNNMKTLDIIKNIDIEKELVNTNVDISAYRRYTKEYENRRIITYISFIILSIFVISVLSIYILNVDKNKRILFGITIFIIALWIYFISYSETDEGFENNSVPIKDILSKIREKIRINIESYIDEINNMTIMRHIYRESHELKDQSEKIRIYSDKINEDKNIRKLDSSRMEFAAHLAFQIILLICIIMIYDNYTSEYILSLILLLLCIIVLVTLYNSNVTRMVRTSADNIYWGKPYSSKL